MLTFSELCNPAKIFAVLSILFLILDVVYMLDNKLFTFTKTFGLILQLIYIYFWSFLLNYLCLNGYGVLSWILVFFPFVVLGIFMIFFMVFVAIDTSLANSANVARIINPTLNPVQYRIVRE